MSLPLDISAQVAAARAAGRPIVALESTIITHGLPWPQNLDVARRIEAAVREAGAEPATIAVLDGRLRVGLDAGTLERLACLSGVRKLSRADLAHALLRGDAGSTTVAATMIVAALAGIAVFATGGIGGVHRDAAVSFDISADLAELARTPVTVVAAGAKAILDLPKTLEVLETLGVPVVCYGTDEFPAFWSRRSGLAAPLRLDTPGDIAAMLDLRLRLGLAGGVLVANPIPASDEIATDAIAPAIALALDAARREGITGKAITPFLLARVLEATDGRSVAANTALVLENARLAAAIAVELAGRQSNK
jgi:pseudouridine-5'-phosphate glycosidase